VDIQINPRESWKTPRIKLWESPSFTEKFRKTTGGDCALLWFVQKNNGRSSSILLSQLKTQKGFITKQHISISNNIRKASTKLTYNFYNFLVKNMSGNFQFLRFSREY
jgi:hypothetical protein